MTCSNSRASSGEMSRIESVGALASLSGSVTGDKDCAGCFVNQHREQLVFVHHPGEAQAVLLHSDLDRWSEQISRTRSGWASGALGVIGVLSGPRRQRYDLESGGGTLTGRVLRGECLAARWLSHAALEAWVRSSRTS
jgi:hypothetical protein